MDNIERNNESRHELYTRLLGRIVVQEPKGWSNDTRSYERDKDSKSITTKITVDLEFYGDGADWLKTLYFSRGIQERVILSKYEKDTSSLSEAWKLKYIQEIDLRTFSFDEKTNGVKVKATEGGLYLDIKNRISNQYNIISPFSADGDDIGNLVTYPFQPQPRGIFLESLLTSNVTGYRINSERYNESRSDTQRTVPMFIQYNSNGENVKSPSNSSEFLNTFIPHDQNYLIGTTQSIGDQFFWRSDIDRSIRLKFDLTFTIARVRSERAENKEMAVELRRSSLVGVNDELDTIETLLYIDAHHTHEGDEYTVSIDRQVDFLEGESMSIVFRTSADLGGTFGGEGYMDTYIDVSSCKTLIQDETSYEATVSRCIKPKDLFERLVAKITGQNGLFKSSIFEEGGEYEHIVLDNGFWARGFPDVVEESDGRVTEIQFNTSFEHAFKSFSYLEPLCWFTEIIGNKEYVRVEKATYTMKNFIGIRLSAVDKVTSDASGPDYFNKIILGHKKTLDYEEINGLDEPNGLTEFGTHITKNDSEYRVDSEYRFDSVGYELIRRFGFFLYPKKDTTRDKDIFMHDAKFVNGVYTHNLWSDHFDSEPIGIFQPETAWNLRLSPMNRLYYGHGYSVSRGLYHYPSNKVRFNSSNSNQNLITTIGGITLYEGGEFANVKVSDLGKPRVEATTVEMTFKITQEIEDQLQGYTDVDGDKVPNFFGLIEYEYGGQKRYGRLVKLDADEESKLKIIKARL